MRFERIITLIIISVIVVGLFYIGFRFFVDIKSSAKDNFSTSNTKKAYAQMVAESNNANALAETGSKLVQGNQLENGIINLERATVVDPKHRDAWVWLGYGYLKNNEPQKAIEALQKAEKIDPINAETFRLLALAYQAADDQESSKKAQEKYNFLTKKQ